MLAGTPTADARVAAYLTGSFPSLAGAKAFIVSAMLESPVLTRQGCAQSVDSGLKRRVNSKATVTTNRAVARPQIARIVITEGMISFEHNFAAIRICVCDRVSLYLGCRTALLLGLQRRKGVITIRNDPIYQSHSSGAGS